MKIIIFNINMQIKSNYKLVKIFICTYSINRCLLEKKCVEILYDSEISKVYNYMLINFQGKKEGKTDNNRNVN